MSKEFQNIDQLFQSELGKMTKSAPASVKKGVNRAIGTKSTKLAWMFGATSIVLISLTSVYFFSPTIESKQTLFGKNELDITLNSKESQSSEIISIESEINDLLTSTSNTLENSQNSTFNGQLSNNNTANYKTKDKSTTSSNPITTNLPLKQNKDVVMTTNDPILTPEKTTSDKDELIVIPSKDDLTLMEKDEIAIIEKEDNPVLINNEKTNNKLNVDSLNATNLVAELDTTETLHDVAIIDSTLEDPDISFENQKEIYSPWFLSLSAGINLKKSAFATSIIADEVAYGNQLTDKIGHSALFEASYRLKNSLTFGAGLGYTALYENFNYYKADVVVTDTNYISSYFLDSIPDSTTMSGWAYFADSIISPEYVYGSDEYYNANGTNSTTYLNIPIKIGTQLIFNKWRLDLFVGGRFNLLLASKTTYIVNNQLVSSKTQSFKNSYFDLTFGASAHIELYNNLFLTGTARYRPPMKSAYYSSEINNRFQNMYIGMGVSLNL